MSRRFVASLGLLLVMAMMPAASAQETTGVPGAPGATTTIDGRYLAPPPQQFRGEIDTNAAQSKPYWPELVVPPKGAPNILLIMIVAAVVFGRGRWMIANSRKYSAV